MKINFNFKIIPYTFIIISIITNIFSLVMFNLSMDSIYLGVGLISFLVMIILIVSFKISVFKFQIFKNKYLLANILISIFFYLLFIYNLMLCWFLIVLAISFS